MKKLSLLLFPLILFSCTGSDSVSAIGVMVIIIIFVVIVASQGNQEKKRRRRKQERAAASEKGQKISDGSEVECSSPMSKLELLKEAIDHQAAIKIKYNGGSQPGVAREIVPNKITGNLVYAFCIASNRVKAFSFDKIDIDGTDESKKESKPEVEKAQSTKTLEFLKTAMDLSASIKIKYNGGSQPGTIREIKPIIFKNDKVRALCIATNGFINFDIDKIDIDWTDEVSCANYKYESLADIYETYLTEWEEYGWHVEFKDDQIGLYSISGKGKVDKLPSVEISYSLTICNKELTKEGEIIEHFKESKLPWIIMGSYEGVKDRGFNQFNKAEKYFLEKSRKISPVSEGLFDLLD